MRAIAAHCEFQSRERQRSRETEKETEKERDREINTVKTSFMIASVSSDPLYRVILNEECYSFKAEQLVSVLKSWLLNRRKSGQLSDTFKKLWVV